MNRTSIIEQAAKRLEELKRSGVAVPKPAPFSDLHGNTAPHHAAAGHVELVGSNGRTEPGRGAPLAPVIAPTEVGRTTGTASRRSATVDVDLARLARLGYVSPGQERSTLAGEFRLIKRALLRNIAREGTPENDRSSLIMITSAVAGEGKTFCAINLAMSIAMEVDTSVLLVDADVVRPAILERLGVPAKPGLLDILTGDVSDLSDVILKTNISKLSILPAGAPRAMATELLASAAMDQMLVDLATRYPDRAIVLDAPPLLLTTESPVLASRVGQVVIVVDAERTPVHKVTQAFATVESCPVVLSLLNKCSDLAASDGYGYRY